MARRIKKYAPPRGFRFEDRALNTTIKDIYDILNSLGGEDVVRAALSRGGGTSAIPSTWRCGRVTLPAANTTVIVVPDPPLDAALNCPNSCATIQVTPADTWGSATEWYVDAETETTFSITVDAAPGSDVDFFWLAMPCPPVSTTPPSVAVWGKYESTDTEGLWVFDINDPKGTITQLFTNAAHTDLGRFEFYDGWIYYGTNEATVPEIWKIRPDGLGDQLVHSGTGQFASGHRISVTYDADSDIFFYWNGNNEIRKWDGTTDSAIRATSTSECQDVMVQGDGTGLYEIKGAATFRRDYSGTLTHTLSESSRRGHMDYATNSFYLRGDGGGSTDVVTRFSEDFTTSEVLSTGELTNTSDDYAYDRDYESGLHYAWEDGPNGRAIYVFDGSFSTQNLVLRFHEATDMRLLKSQYD